MDFLDWKDSNDYIVITLSKGSPLPFEVEELGPGGRQIIGLFYFKERV